MGMSMKKFAAVVRKAIETLPPEIKAHLENVVIDVEDEPTVEFLREAGFILSRIIQLPSVSPSIHPEL